MGAASVWSNLQASPLRPTSRSKCYMFDRFHRFVYWFINCLIDFWWSASIFLAFNWYSKDLFMFFHMLVCSWYYSVFLWMYIDFRRFMSILLLSQIVEDFADFHGFGQAGGLAGRLAGSGCWPLHANLWAGVWPALTARVRAPTRNYAVRFTLRCLQNGCLENPSLQAHAIKAWIGLQPGAHMHDS